MTTTTRVYRCHWKRKPTTTSTIIVIIVRLVRWAAAGQAVWQCLRLTDRWLRWHKVSLFHLLPLLKVALATASASASSTNPISGHQHPPPTWMTRTIRKVRFPLCHYAIPIITFVLRLEIIKQQEFTKLNFDNCDAMQVPSMAMAKERAVATTHPSPSLRTRAGRDRNVAVLARQSKPSSWKSWKTPLRRRPSPHDIFESNLPKRPVCPCESFKLVSILF